MTRHSTRFCALLLAVAALAAALLACGGRSPDIVGDVDGGLDGACAPAPCPSSAPWNPTTCSCGSAVGSSGGDNTGDSGLCTSLSCPTGYVVALVGSSCMCLTVDQQIPDAQPDDFVADTSLPYYPDVYVTPRPDVFTYPPDVWTSDVDVVDSYYYPTDSPSCPYWYYPPNFCGAGYQLSPNCQCISCPNTCPAGETPGSGCSGCVACPRSCPAGFHYGPNCTCLPEGVEAGPMPQPDASDGGVSCLLEGYSQCAAGAWCQLGTCPDGTTQYGCYCNADGTATCSLTCPVPPPCTIPGQASCPAGSQCVYGSCTNNASGDVLVCSCSTYGGYGEGGGNYASCYTASCADGGPQYLDAGTPTDGGVTCLLEGYTSCPAGSWCALGTCPGGQQYGCQCNQNGTATCDLVCPQPPPCQIPGEGTCPYGHQCVFGCNGTTTGTGLSCSCNYYGGSAYCSTVSCSSVTTGDY